ncbi:protein decapping 5 [Ziziphus jujuba]|uniref:Protein decapping 5 n=1 Tax=Ziziphus jujuba TaxID=326968 RepID=A0A6P4AIY9_ZIZJJ|nr:protein decapping 5 [Ziziphus jujuba]
MGSAADSYIGSLISLTSKSEIRYEGVLYNINTEESSIGLRNVRSFGTEGRKKDGPQISPSDKVYEYILFRGADIKDLQVKSSPPAQPAPPPINNDPAIIQSHYTRPVSSSSLPAAVSGPSSDVGSHAAQMGLPGSNFQGGMPPLYQPGGNLGSWGASPPPPSANGGGLAMPPMYWPGYYGPSNGLPHLHQQSLLQPPPGLAMPSSLQQPMQYPNFNAASLSTGASQLPEVPSTLLSAASSSSPNLISTSVSPSTLPLTLPSTLPSTLPPVLSTTLASETIPSSASNKAQNPTLSASTLNASLPSLSPLTTSSLDMNTALPPNTNKSGATSGSTLPYQAVSQSTPSIVGSSNSVRIDTPAPSLVTPGQLLQSGAPAVSSSQSLQAAHKDVEVVQVSSSAIDVPVPVAVSEPQPPILPLPQPARAGQRPTGAPFQNRYSYRGRGRGRGTGSSQPVIKFTEDFDFTAMNEKFMKDEVWGHLGKSSKSHPKDREGDGKVSDEDDAEDDAESSKFEISVPVYNKDDFFDSLSCNALDNQSQSGRTRYSEQMKIDTETFGDFARHRGGRGGRGPARGGRFRGGYYGRGYGYNGRGRGRATYNHPQ